MFRLFRLVILAAVIWGVYYWLSNGPHINLPGSNSSPAPLTPVSTAPPVVQAPPSNSEPIPSKPTPAPQPTDVTAQLSAAKALVTEKTQALAQAKAPILTTLQSQPDYQQAKADAAALQQQVRVARDQGSDNLSDLSNQWLVAKNKVTGMEAAAFDKSPAVQQAQDDLYKAQQAEIAIEKQIADGKGKVTPSH